MDEDLVFGASVWATPRATPITLSPPPIVPPLPTAADAPQDSFDDFDDFGTLPAPASLGNDGVDEDFGDFGDFGDAEDAGSGGGFAGDMAFEDQARLAGPSSSSHDWRPLHLDPLPTRAELEEQIDEVLGPFWEHDDLTEMLTDDDIREVGGLSQILITPESRALYQTLFPPNPPPAAPPNWTRSRIRRQHLITLGIPVNLDEMLPRANGKPMPALHINTRPMSAPPGPRGAPHPTGGPGSLHSSRAGTPVATTPRDGRTAAKQLGLGPKPQLDEQKIQELLALTHDDLSLLPLPALDAHLASIRSQTAKTSELLSYLLQTRDALQQDSETYNKLIAELVMEAQKMKTGVGKGRSVSRRGSGMT